MDKDDWRRIRILHFRLFSTSIMASCARASLSRTQARGNRPTHHILVVVVLLMLLLVVASLCLCVGREGQLDKPETRFVVIGVIASSSVLLFFPKGTGTWPCLCPTAHPHTHHHDHYNPTHRSYQLVACAVLHFRSNKPPKPASPLPYPAAPCASVPVTKRKWRASPAL